MPLIETVNLSKVYGLQPVLKKLNLSIDAGEFVALIGANGSGKSTLLRLLSGLSRPTAGIIRIGGWEIPREIDSVRRQIGVVSHKPLLYETLTASENLRFFARLYHIALDDHALDAALQRVGLAKRGGDLVRGFSRGMQQRLAIARALLHQPDVLIFDEPYTGLDHDGSTALDTLLTSAHTDGRTIVMATHDFKRASHLATRAVILSRGGISADTPLQALDGAALTALYQQAAGR
jgi:heme exporter protein A